MNKIKLLIISLLPKFFVLWVSATRRTHQMRVKIFLLEDQMRMQAQTMGALLNQLDQHVGSRSTSWEKHEYRALSQHGEDGLIQHIFSCIGTTNKKLVEFGCGDGRECNTSFLLLFQEWHGLLMDADPENAKIATIFLKTMLKNGQNQVQIVNSRVTRDNINQLIAGNGYLGEIDLLSIDIDGNDYWIWQSIECVDPRVVVIEYNASFGPNKKVTIPYADEFARSDDPHSWYFGASLAALEDLGCKKGYSLVGCDRSGVNAFFVKKSLIKEPLRKLNAYEAFRPQLNRIYQMTQVEQEKFMTSFPLVEMSR